MSSDMFNRFIILLAASVALLSNQAGAQARRFGGAVGVGVQGGEALEANLAVSIGVTTGFEIGTLVFGATADGFTITSGAGSNDRYRTETFANGTTACRDTRNGQFAQRSKCSGEPVVVFSPLVEAGFRVRRDHPVVFSAGYRFGQLSSPTVAISKMPQDEHWVLRALLSKYGLMFVAGLH
jgi:hypothetical protein